MWTANCAGDNTGSYFREPEDAERIQGVLVDRFDFGGASEEAAEAAPAAQKKKRWGKR